MTLSDPNLKETLRLVAELLEDATGPWWVITGAAAALYGVATNSARDVDVLVTKEDAQRLKNRNMAFSSGKGATSLFRSAAFLEVSSAPLNIELMAEFEIYQNTIWIPVIFNTINWRTVDGKKVCIPSRLELISLFRKMGRPKDIARANLLAKITD